MKKLLFALLYIRRVSPFAARWSHVSAAKSTPRVRPEALVLSTGVLVVYLSFLSRSYYWDGITFALAIPMVFVSCYLVEIRDRR